MRSRVRGIAATAVLMVTGAWLALAQGTSAPSLVPPSQAPPKPPTPIAFVGDRPISREEFQARETQAMADYHSRLGQDVPEELKPALRRQILESLIRREMLALEARRRNVTASDADADAELRKDPFFNPGGRFDFDRYQVVKTTQPDNYRRAIEQMKMGLAARTLNDRLEREFVGDDPGIRARAIRDLSRAALEYLALPRPDFMGTFREPRELEIVDEYRGHPADYHRPARAVFTALQVDQPPLPDGESPTSPAGREWKARMRSRADSALAEMRRGTTFEALEKTCGGIHHDVAVTPDNFPGFWQGDARDRAAVFAATPGSLLAAPVSGRTGWMVVRVDRIEPAHTASLAEVAPQIRERLRLAARARGDEPALRALYAQESAKFRTSGWRVRYAVFDTSSTSVGDPAEAELDRWYRAHQADYSTFDAAAGRIAVRPLEAVRGQVAARWRTEQRQTRTHLAADQLQGAWSRRQRDRALEGAAVAVREVGPIVAGAPVDTGLAASALSDTLRDEAISLRVGTLRWARGWLTYHVYQEVPGFVPPFEQVRGQLQAEFDATREQQDEQAAHALYDKDPSAFSSGQAVYFSRVIVDRPSPMNVPLTRAEVEDYHRAHLDRYSAPEMIRVRHILSRPSGPGSEADEEARKRAEDLLARARKGEDFAELARRYSDDIATREKGGDLGFFSHGTMLEAFEQAAFKLKSGEISDVVRTEAGYDIIFCVQHDPIVAQPLRFVYSNVGWDAAEAKGESLAAHRADSLAAALRSPAEARAAARKMGLTIDRTFHRMGDRKGLPEAVSFQIRLERTTPGRMVPGTGYERNSGYYVAWVDSIAPAVTPGWENARSEALDRFRRLAGQRALDAKRAELDSMLASGWSLDSLATLFGGFTRIDNASPGKGLGPLGGAEIVDSLAFGTRHGGPVLKPGETSGWLDLPGGYARLRLMSRTPPDPGRLSAKIENDRRMEFERKLYGYFEDLKKRYAIRILDPKLRDTPLPPPPPSHD